MRDTEMQALNERLGDYELGLLDTPEGLEHFKERMHELFRQQKIRAWRQGFDDGLKLAVKTVREVKKL